MKNETHVKTIIENQWTGERNHLYNVSYWVQERVFTFLCNLAKHFLCTLYVSLQRFTRNSLPLFFVKEAAFLQNELYLMF